MQLKSIRHRLLFTFVCGAVVAASPGAGAKLALASGAGAQASFTAAGPAGLRVHGTTSEISVNEDARGARVTVALARMTTGISLRDRHMREHLGVDKFPNAELVVARGGLKVPAAPGASVAGATATGTMTIHGQSRPVMVRYDAKRDGATIHVSGTTAIDMTDYGIATPSYMGVSVKPGVQIAVSFDVVDAAQ